MTFGPSDLQRSYRRTVVALTVALVWTVLALVWNVVTHCYWWVTVEVVGLVVLVCVRLRVRRPPSPGPLRIVVTTVDGEAIEVPLQPEGVTEAGLLLLVGVLPVVLEDIAFITGNVLPPRTEVVLRGVSRS